MPSVKILNFIPAKQREMKSFALSKYLALWIFAKLNAFAIIENFGILHKMFCSFSNFFQFSIHKL